LSSPKLKRLEAQARKIRAKKGLKLRAPGFTFRYPDIPGYSMERVFLVGLSLPGFVMAGLLLGFYASSLFELSTTSAFIISIIGTFAGFGCGTILLVRLSNKITDFAKKEC